MDGPLGSDHESLVVIIIIDAARSWFFNKWGVVASMAVGLVIVNLERSDIRFDRTTSPDVLRRPQQ
ncbi:hypothetical protein [Pseudarthrobacter sp. YAF2]|uniref:hypothetical protein n=1 Tax=Pseudarthrobacter sp. YAF2 TaxID=3233078 RepID=UPI003F9862C3